MAPIPPGGQTKYGAVAHFSPQNGDELAQEGASALIAQRARRALLQAFFQQARLEL
jgi:hypothetical protein